MLNNLTKYIFISLLFSGIIYAYYFQLKYFPLRVISLIGFVVFYISLLQYFLIRFKKNDGTLPKRSLLLLYIAATLLIFILSIKFNVKDIITLLFHPFAFGAFFIGIVAFLVNQKSIKFLVKLSHYINNFIPIITLIDVLIFNHPVFLITCHTFLLFEYCFAPKKRKYYLLAVMFASLLPFIIYDYRSGLILTLLFISALFSIYFFKKFRSKLLKGSFLLASFFAIYYLSFNFTEVYQLLTSYIKGDIINTVDTRSFLYLEFFEDFKPSEYFLGRGYLGTYFSAYFDSYQGEGGDNNMRFVVEIGFLQILFKGGLLLLVLTIIIFIKSIIKGLFKNKPSSLNFFLALWLLIELSMFSVQNIPAFTPHFFIIWVIIGILLNKESTKQHLIVNN